MATSPCTFESADSQNDADGADPDGLVEAVQRHLVAYRSCPMRIPDSSPADVQVAIETLDHVRGRALI